METTENQNNSSIKLNLDEFDLESFEIKPVTKGLGFHNSTKTKAIGARPSKNNLNLKKNMTLNKKIRSPQSQVKTPHYLQSTPQTVSDPSLMSGIEALYSDRKEIKPEHKAPVKTKSKKTSLKKAAFSTRIMAHICDLLFISLIMLLLFISFFFFAFNDLNLNSLAVFIKDSLPFLFVLSFLVYVSYFSLLEPVGTIGKRLFNLGTFIYRKKKRCSIKASFLRSLISFLSLPLLGLPLILEFQDKMTNTRVYKTK